MESLDEYGISGSIESRIRKKKAKLIWSKNRLTKQTILISSSHAKRGKTSIISTLVDGQATGTLISVSGVAIRCGIFVKKMNFKSADVCACVRSAKAAQHRRSWHKPRSPCTSTVINECFVFCYSIFFIRFVRFSRTLANRTGKKKNINRLLLLLLRIYQTWI